ncbi:MAG: Holliday junction resolvase RuvX [Dongiaceae bacterium]
MIVADVTALCAALPRHQRLFGLDLGEKTIGIAVSDPGLHVATPVSTIKRTKFTLDAKELIKLIQERQVGGLVIGLPLNMDGTEGPRCQSVRQFAANFLPLHEIPIAFWDERLSTVAVTRDMIDADLTRAKRAKAVDRAAAAFILQGALDFHQRQRRDG